MMAHDGPSQAKRSALRDFAERINRPGPTLHVAHCVTPGATPPRASDANCLQPSSESHCGSGRRATTRPPRPAVPSGDSPKTGAYASNISMFWAANVRGPALIMGPRTSQGRSASCGQRQLLEIPPGHNQGPGPRWNASTQTGHDAPGPHWLQRTWRATTCDEWAVHPDQTNGVARRRSDSMSCRPA